VGMVSCEHNAFCVILQGICVTCLFQLAAKQTTPCLKKTGHTYYVS